MSSDRNKFHAVSGTFQVLTDKDALCVKIDGKDEWFPMGSWNCDQPMINFERGDEIDFEAQYWIMESKGLEHLAEDE